MYKYDHIESSASSWNPSDIYTYRYLQLKGLILYFAWNVRGCMKNLRKIYLKSERANISTCAISSKCSLMGKNKILDANTRECLCQVCQIPANVFSPEYSKIKQRHRIVKLEFLYFEYETQIGKYIGSNFDD